MNRHPSLAPTPLATAKTTNISEGDGFIQKEKENIDDSWLKDLNYLYLYLPIMAVGTARPMAHGHDTTNVARAKRSANAKFESPFVCNTPCEARVNHTTNTVKLMTTMTGTKYDATLSATRWTGGLELWAC